MKNSGRCDNEQGHCHVSAAKSQLSCKYKEVNSAIYKEPGIFGNGNRLYGDDVIPAKREGGIDFQIVSKASANGGSDCKGIVKPFFIHKVSSEKEKGRSLYNKMFRQENMFGLSMQRGTKLVANKFKVKQWEVNNNSEIRTCN